VREAPDPARVPPEHHGLHGRPRVREPWPRTGRREDGDGGRERPGAEAHGRRRGIVRSGQLRDGGPRVLAPPAVDVAECADQRHGRPAGGERAAPGPARCARSRGTDDDRGRAGRIHDADPRDIRAAGLALLLDRAAVGRRDHRPGGHAAGAGPRPGGRGRQRADPGDVLRRLPDGAGGECSRRFSSRTGARSRCG
jgi:hypothetical protein